MTPYRRSVRELNGRERFHAAAIPWVATSREHVQTITMGANRERSGLPDLFTTVENWGRSAHPSRASDELTSPQIAPRRHFLPKDLANSIKALDDHDFDRLVAAVLTEQQRRGLKSPSNENLQQRRAENSTFLNVGLLRAIRAARTAEAKAQVDPWPAKIPRRAPGSAGSTG